jgi:plasmid stabilization system protein ParE
MYVSRLKKHVAKLRDLPELGAGLAEGDDPQVREIQHGNYRVIYRYDGISVFILAVIHAARLLDPKRLLEE